MAKTATPPPVVDPWLIDKDGNLDPFVTGIDWGANDRDLRDPDILEEPLPEGDPVLEQHGGLQPEVIVPPDPEPDEPETLDLEDGTQLVLQKDKGWWVGSVVGQTGSAQIYKGATKNKLILEVLKAQANATKKIRQLNTEVKYGTVAAKTPPPPPTPTPTPSVKSLSADDIFEFKTQLESNPELAFDTFFQKKTGLTVQQLVSLAQKGADRGEYAANQLTAEQVNKVFLANNPDYYPDPDYTNFGLLVKWLAKFKLGEAVARGQETAMFEKLISTGHYTVENLEAAFEDLRNDQALTRAPLQVPLPRVDPPPPVQVQQEPAPAPRPNSRIVSTEVRPRAALGLRPTDITPVREPEAPKAPSAEDFENMTDEQIKNTLSAVQRFRALQNRRSN